MMNYGPLYGPRHDGHGPRHGPRYDGRTEDDGHGMPDGRHGILMKGLMEEGFMGAMWNGVFYGSRSTSRLRSSTTS